MLSFKVILIKNKKISILHISLESICGIVLFLLKLPTISCKSNQKELRWSYFPWDFYENFQTRPFFGTPTVGKQTDIYLLTVNYRNTRTRREICWKLTLKIPERHWRCFGIFIFNFEHISHLILVFLLLTLNMQLPVGQERSCQS